MEELFIAPNSLKVLIKNYYKNNYNVDASVTFSSAVGDYYDMIDSSTSIKVEYTYKVKDIELKYSKILTEDDIRIIIESNLKETLDSGGYTLKKVTLDTDLRYDYEGYYMNEHIVQKVVFKGSNVSIEKNKRLTLGEKM